MGFYDMLKQIKDKPGLYLSRSTIFDLESFLLGYEVARTQIGLEQTDEEKEFSEFILWVRDSFPVKTDRSWTNIILFYSADEKIALKKCFELLDDFLQQKRELAQQIYENGGSNSESL
jgi:hypothetical protein